MSCEAAKRPPSTGAIVRPRPFASGRSYMETIGNFVKDAYNGQQTKDEKDTIVWVRFGIVDSIQHLEGEAPSLFLLLLGYTNGLQIWTFHPNGEAHESLSLRSGPIKVAQMIPPLLDAEGQLYSAERPLLGLCDASGTGPPFCSVSLVSLRSGVTVHRIPFQNPVVDLLSNRNLLVVGFEERVATFSISTFENLFCIATCYPSPGPNLNPLALSSRWLAYADRKLVPGHQSRGGMCADGMQSYTAAALNFAKTISKGLVIFGEKVSQQLSKSSPTSEAKVEHHHGNQKSSPEQNPVPGIVTVIDTLGVAEKDFRVGEDCGGEGVVAHFPAHADQPLAAMSFDPSGTLLLTADGLGQNFHLFRLVASPCCSRLGAVHHLYTLHRGETTASVQHMAFSRDSRWVAVSTLRGTSHVFPVLPYGGEVGPRTHTSHQVMNKDSRFRRSAGLTDLQQGGATQWAPPHGHAHHHSASHHHMHSNNPQQQQPPWSQPNPHPVTVSALAQIKQPLSLPPAVSGEQTPSPDSWCVATLFAGPPAQEEGVAEVLFVLGYNCTLEEYRLEPHGTLGAGGSGKRGDESVLGLTTSAKARWHLQRCSKWPEVKAGVNNQLVLASQAALLPSSENLEAARARSSSVDSYGSGSDKSLSDQEDSWLAQVEMVTHMEPHRQLWMGPQFHFIPYPQASSTTVLSSGSAAMLSHNPEAAAADLNTDEMDLQSLKIHAQRSQPVPTPAAGHRGERSPSTSDMGSIETGSDSFEQASTMLEVCGSWPEGAGSLAGGGLLPDTKMKDSELRQTLADAMNDIPTTSRSATTTTVIDENHPSYLPPGVECLDISSNSVDSLHPASNGGATTNHILIYPTNSNSDSN